MSGKNMIDLVANDRNTHRNNMMDMWQDSIDRAREKQESPSGIAEKAVADMEEALRRKQEGCQRCQNRRYQDGSSDGAVSFQTPSKMPGDVSMSVRAHEREHVMREGAKAKERGREVLDTQVALIHSVCPECGMRFVAGGETKVKTAAAQQEPPKRPGSLSAKA